MISSLIWFILILYGLSYLLPIDAKSKLHGSSRWGKKDIRPSNKGLVIDGVNALSQKDSYTHALIVSPTGAGKSQNYVYYNILRRDNCSLVVTDPKGELFELCAPYLKSKGFKVLRLDHQDLSNSIRYNPMDTCTTESAIKSLAKNIIGISQGGANAKDPFWNHGAENLLFILISCVQGLPSKYRTLATVISLLNHMEDGTPKVEYFVKKNSPHPELYQKYKAFISQEQKIRLGQLATAQAAMSLWDTHEIKTLTSESTIDFSTLREEKIALFLNLPIGSTSSIGALLSIFFNQWLTKLMNTSLAENALPIYVIMEEFGAIKRIPKLTEAVALLRSKKVSLSFIVQNLGMIDKLYSKEIRETLLSNCSSVIIYPGQREKHTLDFVEQMMGERTIETFIPGTYGIRLDKRALLTKAEIRTMKHSLFLFGNEEPMKIYPTPLWQNKSYLKKTAITSINGVLQSKDLPLLSQSAPLYSTEYQYYSIDEIIDPELYNRKKVLSEMLHKKEEREQVFING